MPAKSAAPSPHELFARFLDDHGISPSEAGRKLDVSHAAVFDWKNGKKTPSTSCRLRIEKWTKGAIPASAWESEEDREAIERVKPFDTQLDPIPA